MALPLTINNPQTSEPISSASPTVTGDTINYAGNALGSGATATAGLNVSNILIYGAIGLFIVWLLQRLDD